MDDMTVGTVVDADSTDGDGQFEMLPLTPAYDEVQHGLYVRHLREALGQNQNQLRNIALTGSYGIGKSSILQAVAKEFGENRVINLSLSTLGDEPPTAGSSDTNVQGAPASTTNRIQKEIVKQLLYREDPVRVPGSRYRRIGSFKWWRELTVSVLFSSALVILGYLAHFTDRLVNLARDNFFGRAGLHGLLLAVLAASILVIRKIFHNRIWVEKLSTGPASISLSRESGSYFDEYLDEIVYFFEVTNYDIVIFEDIDRFEEPHIFQTLRELNTILNNSRQVHRRIRFIYAIKDSIFEQLGADDEGSDKALDRASDAADAEIERANRTKFFDLVIPVVPFITHRSARDHMTDILAGSQLGISKKLVNLVAKHVADMRLIKNIHNEYGLFRERLLLAKDGLPGLESESLFAMIVYKNIHLSDFERIKSDESRLDKLYRDGRKLVAEHVSQLDEEALGLQRKIGHLDSSVSMSESLGDHLTTYIRRVMRHSGIPGNTPFTTSMGSSTYSNEDLRTADFWRAFVAGQQQLSVTAQYRGSLQFSFDDVREALGDDLSPTRWERQVRDSLNRRLATIDDTREFLLHADMGNLMARPEFEIRVGGQDLSFADLAERQLSSRLALELVAEGYIDRNFTLYASQFFGVHVGPQAMNFILHNVQPNRMDVNYSFSSPADIEAVLDEFGNTVLNDRSMYNIEMLNYLLAQEDDRCDPIVRNLSASRTEEKSFMSAYLARGVQRETMFRRMAGFWPDVFDFIVNDIDVDDETRTAMFNAALTGSQADAGYELNDSIRRFVEENYAAMEVLTKPQEQTTSTGQAVAIMAALAVKLASLRPLSPEVKQGVVEGSLYTISEENLVAALGGVRELSLDSIKAIDRNVYSYALENLKMYILVVTKEAFRMSQTINSPSEFVEILEDAAKHDLTAIKLLAERAFTTCCVENIRDITSSVWPALAEVKRFQPTLSNVEAYVEVIGGIDAALADLLFQAGGIKKHKNAPEEAKQEIATLILRATISIPHPETRVGLVKSLELADSIRPSQIEAQNGRFIGLLIRDQIIADDAESFGLTLPFDWPTREFAIKQSRQFAKYVDPALVPAEDLGTLMASQAVPAAVKAAILTRLPEFAAGATPAALTEVASYAITENIELDEDSLRIMAEGKVDPVTIVTLLEPHLEDFEYLAVEGILKSIGRPYASLAKPGGHQVKLPRTPDHLALVQYLEKFGYASSNNYDKGLPELRVFMRKA